MTERERQAKERLCLALDLNDEAEILRTVDALVDVVGYFKLNSAFTLFGPSLLGKLLEKGCRIFLDLKIHDIPNTVGWYADAVTRLGVHIVTIHTAGGSEMMQEALSTATRTAHDLGVPRPKFIGVTLLTSIGQQILNEELEIPGSVEDEVFRRARLAAAAGLDGIVCSALELPRVRREMPNNFFCVTPGVRPSGSDPHDHKRVLSYSEAVAAGSDLLVLGRTITGASDKRLAAEEALREIANVIQV